MKIISLQVQNFMKLVAVEIKPDGNTVFITGKNGHGKSSVLDSIWAVLEWAQASKKIKEPIHTGEVHAENVIDFGEFVATRTFTAKGTTLKIQNADGATYPSPQAFLDKFKGALSFDPLAFVELSDKEQAATLRGLVGIDTTELDAKRVELYEFRASWNRQAKERAGALVGHAGGDVPDDTPDEEVSVSELMAELEAAERQQSNNNLVRGELEVAERRARDFVSRIIALQEQIAELDADHNESLTDISTLNKRTQALIDPDIDAIKQQIASADGTNKAIRDRKDFQLIEAQKIEAEDYANTLTSKIDDIDAEKRKAIEAAQFPIDGLGFDENGVTFNDIPFSQASSAEQIRVSLAIAMALNPDLRVIRIADGSLLDSDNLAIIEQMAGENDFQIWIEKVDDTGTIGVYIEDGHVVEKPAAEREATV
jgi:ABC-type dipeptide/oligopeptide/nickel transport system ATPase component